MKSYFKRNMENLKNGIEGRMSNAFNDVALATPASLMPLIAPLTVLTFAGLTILFSGCTGTDGVENVIAGGFENTVDPTTTVIAGSGSTLIEAGGGSNFFASTLNVIPEGEVGAFTDRLASAAVTAEETGQPGSLDMTVWSADGSVELEESVTINFRGGVSAEQSFKAGMGEYATRASDLQRTATATATAAATASAAPTPEQLAEPGITSMFNKNSVMADNYNIDWSKNFPLYDDAGNQRPDMAQISFDGSTGADAAAIEEAAWTSYENQGGRRPPSLG